MVYGDFDGPGRRKNKPKQTQSRLAPSTAGRLKNRLKKQSQFVGGINEHKRLYERKIWQYTALRGGQKQSQS